jgi:hypothetical protein
MGAMMNSLTNYLWSAHHSRLKRFGVQMPDYVPMTVTNRVHVADLVQPGG